MTEEIIIDGVNVAGWTDEEVYYKFEHHTSKAIKQIAFDLYKQLKRAEIEIEKLKGVDGSVHPDSAYYKIARLEQENKKLKKDVQLFKCLDTFGENECHCACRCLGNEFCEDADKKINSYRSALEEIKAIINQPCDNCKYNKDGVTCSIGDCGEGKLKIIETKINEVLNG